MKKGDPRGRLGLRSERLRQLTGLSQGDMGQVAGGTVIGDVVVGGGMLTTIERDSAGRARSRTCYM